MDQLLVLKSNCFPRSAFFALCSNALASHQRMEQYLPRELLQNQRQRYNGRKLKLAQMDGGPRKYTAARNAGGVVRVRSSKMFLFATLGRFGNRAARIQSGKLLDLAVLLLLLRLLLLHGRCITAAAAFNVSVHAWCVCSCTLHNNNGGSRRRRKAAAGSPGDE